MAKKKDQLILILSTVDQEQKALEIAQKLVEQKVAACATVTGRCTSFFYWENKLCKEKEWLLLIKSTEEKWHKLEAALRDLHPYQVPEVVYLKLDGAHAPYAHWLLQAVGGTP